VFFRNYPRIFIIFFINANILLAKYEIYYIGDNITSQYIPFEVYRWCQDGEDPTADHCAPKIHISLDTPLSGDVFVTGTDVSLSGTTIANALVNIILTGDTNESVPLQADTNGNYTYTFSTLDIGNYILTSHVLA